MGKWISKSKCSLKVLHENYQEHDLDWESASFPCGIDSGRIGVYDHEHYKVEDPDSDFNNGVSWGHTNHRGFDGFCFIQVGIDDNLDICGIREECDIDYFCDNCNRDIIDGIRYNCLDCSEYDLCQLCYTNNTHGHDSTHKLEKIVYESNNNFQPDSSKSSKSSESLKSTDDSKDI